MQVVGQRGELVSDYYGVGLRVSVYVCGPGGYGCVRIERMNVFEREGETARGTGMEKE